ncbi:MAG: hypothetical protein A2X28_00255 [Elusimicrobia bacterium GWA2_56_46]|jgi:endonuclease/exonuclease/phosphatase family metal-dependent hydrolase|nr:MAG: hypothetical protein A2X28_00255 [Elusimicrobia bacterium GWA2_56_46]OGR55799.1 MAG: hypothetical protein A2X39_05630 [Elusimicrobia bacterium GWC2_56_31]HBB68013.1 hypothetical protein [Elusimicrobiota bacterium]HBW22269.1 hypothetical protein [Elusimicrobiota bacterium]
MNDEKSFTKGGWAFLPGLAFGLAVFAGFAACRSAGVGVVRESLEIRAMTFNVRLGSANDGSDNWENRRDMVFDVLRRYKPDVVGLQEPLRFQLDQIRRAVPEYGELGVGREAGGTEGEYSPILYRRSRFTPAESGTFWFSDTPETAGSSNWGNAYIRICTWARFVEKKTGGAFYVFNVHLDNVSQASREKSVILLVKRILGRSRPDPVVVTGDFNVAENNSAVRYLTAGDALEAADVDLRVNPIPMVDTFRALHGDARGTGTFHEFKGNSDGEKIDYIFTSPEISVAESEILRDSRGGRYPSDHFPVSARLYLPPSAGRW